MTDEPYYSDDELDEMVEKAAELRQRPTLKGNKHPSSESPGRTEMGGEPCPLCGESVLSLPGHLPECDEK